MLGLGGVAIWASLGSVALAAATEVGLGTATPFAVLAGTQITNTGSTTIDGDLGLSPGSGVTGAPAVTGTTYIDDPVAVQAKSDLTDAYLQAAGEGPVTQEGADLTGDTLVPGVYDTSSDGALGLTGALVLNGEGDPNAVFIFQTGSSLTMGTSSVVTLENGASACNVFWQVGSSAALDGPTFVGTVLALTSITLGAGVTVNGRVLARNGLVSFISDTINSSSCTVVTPVTGAFGAGPDGLPLGVVALACMTVGILATSTGVWMRRQRA